MAIGANELIQLLIFFLLNLIFLFWFFQICIAFLEGQELGQFRFNRAFMPMLIHGIVSFFVFVGFQGIYESDYSATNFYSGSINWNLVLQLSLYWITAQLTIGAFFLFYGSLLNLATELVAFLRYRTTDATAADFWFCCFFALLCAVLTMALGYFIFSYPESF